MKRNFKRFISLLMTLTLMLSVSITDTKHVHAEENLSAILLTEHVETTADDYFAIIEFTAPYDETYTFRSVSVNTWDGYGFIFDESADVDQIIADAKTAIENGEIYARDMITEGYLVSEDDDTDGDNGSHPSIDVEISKGDKYIFLLCGYNIDCYGEADVIVSLTHGNPIIKDKVYTSCSEAGYTGDIYCGLETCGKLLEEGKEIEPHTPDNIIKNTVAANCYVKGYAGDSECTVCGGITPGADTDNTSHEYENNICKHCGNVEYAKRSVTYTLETTENLPYKVIGFKAPFAGEFEFCTKHTDENTWDGYGYLFAGSVNIDEIILDGIADIPVNDDNTRLIDEIDSCDDYNDTNMPTIIYEMEKDEIVYFVMGGYCDDDVGKFDITINCSHLNTEIRNRDIVSCVDGGYTGDLYCLDCETLVVTGSELPAGTEHVMAMEIIKSAVCNAYAVAEYSCNVCEYSYTEEYDEDGYGDHEHIRTGYVAPTCTKDGQTGTYVCKYCGDVEGTNTVIKAYHSLTDEEGYNPNYSYYENKKTETCMVDGYTGDIWCPQCDEIFEKGVNISATGHEFVEGVCTGCGIEENILPLNADGYYEIDSVDDIVVFIINSNKGIKGKLIKDINVPDNYTYEDIPICNAKNSLLDGGNHKIQNWNLEDTYFLFDSINHSTIKNLTVEVNVPENNENYGRFGVIGNEAYNSTFENITINGTIFDKEYNDYQGGIVGYAEHCKFINCINNADITVNNGNSGGIAGDGLYLEFINCVNNGDIHAGGDEIGGIIGETEYSKFENCKNTGKITTDDEQAGGIAGVTYDSIIDGCTNNGNVLYVGTDKSQDELGGIVGTAYDATEISNCINNGDIGGTHEDVEEVAGIAGQVYYGGKIVNCINNGNINAPGNRAGGIVGDHEYTDDETGNYVLEIIGCINNGNVYSKEYSAGIIGEGISVEVKDCVNNGNITGNSYVAGIIGYGENATIDNCYNTGKIGDGTGFGIANSEEEVTITNSEEKHIHKFDIQKVIKAATATTDGEAEQLCKCGTSNGKIVLKKTGKENTTKVNKPARTKIKTIKNIKKKKVKLTWKKIKNVKGYQIRYATNKKFKKAKIKTVKRNITKVALKKLSKKKYYVQVRAYRVANGKKVTAKWSKTKTIKVKK